MKLMQVSFNIDVTNVDHVNALDNFMRVLGEHEEKPKKRTPRKPAKKKDEEPAPTPEPEAETEATEEAAPEKPTKPAKEKAAKKEEPEDDKPMPVTELRSKVASLVKDSPDNRVAIKAKLEELGATSVSNLAIKHYDALEEFLNTL